MNRILRPALGVLAFVFIPYTWIVCNITFPLFDIAEGKKPRYTGFIYLFNTWLDHWLSGEAWGVFDE